MTFRWVCLALASVFSISAVARGDDLPASLYVEGYANQVSYAPGEEVVLHASTTAGTFNVTVSRIAADATEVLAKSGIPGVAAPIPENASSHGCGWPEAFRFRIPEDWATGYYAIRFSAPADAGRRNRRRTLSCGRRSRERRRRSCCSSARIHTTPTTTGAEEVCMDFMDALDCRGTVFRSIAPREASSRTGSGRSPRGPNATDLRSTTAPTGISSSIPSCLRTTGWC